MEIHHGYAPWNGPGGQTKEKFGSADYHVALSQGKSAGEIAEWARNNQHLIGGEGVGGSLWNTIMSAERNAKDIQNRYKSYASSGTSNISDSQNVNTGSGDIIGNGSVGRDSKVGVWTPGDFDGNPFVAQDSFNTTIDQFATVNNSTTTNIGNNNTFGAGSSVGNNNAVTTIDQSAKGGEYNINNALARGEAKERAAKRLRFSDNEDYAAI